ncbi:MAG: uncharacterized protein JWL73_2177 [Actinomycetia bacterium]|nr:uncharacterized protein [Actinomycetes bacterium]
MRTRLAAVLVAGLLLATAACGGGSKDTASTSTTRSSTTTTGTIETTTTGGATTTSGPTTTTTVACPPPAGASTDPQSTPAPSDPALLTNVEAHRDGCHDVVTFTFRTAAPGATAKYVTGPITQDGSGAVVNVPGNAHLVIRMEPAAATDIVGGGTPTYNGPKAFAPAGARAVQGLVFTGDFEGVVTWVVGLSTQVPFTMSSSGNSLSISL